MNTDVEPCLVVGRAADAVQRVGIARLPVRCHLKCLGLFVCDCICVCLCVWRGEGGWVGERGREGDEGCRRVLPHTRVCADEILSAVLPGTRTLRLDEVPRTSFVFFRGKFVEHALTVVVVVCAGERLIVCLSVFCFFRRHLFEYAFVTQPTLHTRHIRL